MRLPLLFAVFFVTISAREVGEAFFSEETKKALRLESQADFAGRYSTDGKLDIGIKRKNKERSLYHPIRFTLDQLDGFFDAQKHKNLIVITIDKHTWTEEELAKHISRLRDYFVARGYKKIVIEQAYSSARGIHLEYSKPKSAKENTDQVLTDD